MASGVAFATEEAMLARAEKMPLLGSVGANGHEVGFMLVGRRDVQKESVPEAESNPPVGQDRGIEDGAGIEGQLRHAGAVGIHGPEGLGPFFVILFEIAGAVADEDDAAVGKVDAGDVVERPVGQLHQPVAVGADFVEVEPVLAVAPHAEEDSPAVVGRFGIEDLALGEVRDAGEDATGSRGHERIEMAARARRCRGPLQRMLCRGAVVDIALAPVIRSGPRQILAFVARAEDLVRYENDAGERFLAEGRRGGDENETDQAGHTRAFHAAFSRAMKIVQGCLGSANE
mgnify:CR=1 FL=1